jgi:plastocyanin
MRRAVVAFAVVALVGTLLAGGRSTGDAHASSTCTRHAKRVVKHVRRNGKRKRVVRVKHYWTCQEAAPPAASPPSLPSQPPAATTPPAAEPPGTNPSPEPEPEAEPEPEGEANALGVSAEDKEGLRYTLTRSTVKAGRLTVELNDKGEDPHTMAMQRIGPEGEPEGPVVAMLETEPGEQRTAPVEVQPGTYKMWCTIGRHAENGMKATITVE